MATSEPSGPIDLLVVQFPLDAEGAGVRSALLDLIDSGTIRLYDLLVVRKDDNGAVTEVDTSTISDGSVGLEEFAGARSGLLGGSDLADLAELIDLGATGAVLLYENTWARPFVAAAIDAGGELVATARLTAQSIIDALDDVEATD